MPRAIWNGTVIAQTQHTVLVNVALPTLTRELGTSTAQLLGRDRRLRPRSQCRVRRG